METWTSPVQFLLWNPGLQEGPSSSKVIYKLHKTVVPKATCSAMENESHTYSGGGVQAFFIFTPTWGSDPMWLIFFKWVEHQLIFLEIHPLYKQILVKSDKFKVLYKWQSLPLECPNTSTTIHYQIYFCSISFCQHSSPQTRLSPWALLAKWTAAAAAWRPSPSSRAPSRRRHHRQRCRRRGHCPSVSGGQKRRFKTGRFSNFPRFCWSQGIANRENDVHLFWQLLLWYIFWVGEYG